MFDNSIKLSRSAQWSMLALFLGVGVACEAVTTKRPLRLVLPLGPGRALEVEYVDS